MMAGFNHFNRFADNLKPSLQRGLKRTATSIAGDASDTAPKRTGFMASKIYVSAPGESTYGTGPAPSQKGTYLLPEVKPEDDMTVIVGAAANYSVFVNYGTRFMAAQPFWEPAIERGKETLAEETALAFKEAFTL